MPTDGCGTGRVGDSMTADDGVLQRVEQETVSSRATPSEELVGQHVLLQFTREIAAWLGYVDPKHEAGKWIQPITKGTLRATEAWTEGRSAVDDKHVELDHELAVALASVMEGAAASTVKKVTQVQPSHGFVAWLAAIDGCAPKSSNDPAFALTAHTRDTHKDAKISKEKLT